MIKQFAICRCDLGLRKGALAAQITHACGMWLAERITNGMVVGGGVVNMKVSAVYHTDELQWLSRPSTLIILRAETKEQFLEIAEQLAAAGIEHHIWHEEDLGDEPTCLATPPIDEELIRPITSGLKLLQ